MTHIVLMDHWPPEMYIYISLKQGFSHESTKNDSHKYYNEIIMMADR